MTFSAGTIAEQRLNERFAQMFPPTPPVLSTVEAFDPFDQTPISGPSTPDVCENLA